MRRRKQESHSPKMQFARLRSSPNPQIIPLHLLIFNSILILVNPLCYVCGQTITNNQTTPASSPTLNHFTQLPVIETTTTTSAPTTTTTVSSSELLLLGVNEFVDYTESPALLIDTLSETLTTNITQSQPRIKSNQTADSPSTSSSLPSTVPSISPAIDLKPDLTTTSTAKPPPVHATTATPGPQSTTTTIVAVPAQENGSNDTRATDPVDPTAQPEEETTPAGDDQASSAEEEGTLDEGAPFEPPKNVTEYMDYIERLFHDFRHQITDLFEPHIPRLIRTSQMVQLSGSCSFDMLRMALALRRFEPWALRMIDSSGKIPEGIFEGSFTALGSYDECLATEFSPNSASRSPTGVPMESSPQQQQQQQVTQGKYCLVNVSPFLPPKPPADRVERLFQEEANRRNYTKDNQFSRLSPMFYYMKFRIGVCLPSTCLESDMDSISSALSSSLRLNITVPHCRVKQSQPITNQQLVGGSIFGLVVALIVGATMVDLWARKLNQMSRRERRLVMSATSNQQQDSNTTTNSVFIGFSGGITRKPGGEQQHTCQSVECCLDEASGRKSAEEKFANRLAKHWTWLSFSLLTNFKLYFLPKWSGVSSPGSQVALSSSSSLPTKSPTPLPAAQGSQPQEAKCIIKCLDGIRVISLCWVILANSYVTLDPRATKLLSETRKAPKDFLFQLVVQASLAIETFFFLSGLLMSLSFHYKLKPTPAGNNNGTTSRRGTIVGALNWIQFYVHRYVRMTPATMLVIAFTMFAFRFGDGPLWMEATHKAHQSCRQNWWRHLLHVANFVDTRQMCFIHYWYIAADMQLFLVAPLLMFLLYQQRRRWLGYTALLALASLSLGSLFYTTYMRNLPPTLLFYNSDPESRREYGNTIMTKPLTHAMPYMVGMLLGKWLLASQTAHASTATTTTTTTTNWRHNQQQVKPASGASSLGSLFGVAAILVALAELFLPYKWNNSHLPSRLLGSMYAALFRLGWSLVLAYLVLSCRHLPDKRCRRARLRNKSSGCSMAAHQQSDINQSRQQRFSSIQGQQAPVMADPCGTQHQQPDTSHTHQPVDVYASCMCGSGGSLLNRFLSLPFFTHLSKLSFVAYLIHLPLMSVFVSQTRGLFAFSHMLVLHLALSYLLMTFILAFVLVHLIEFPFITFERYLFERLRRRLVGCATKPAHRVQHHSSPQHANRRSPASDTRLRVDIEDLRRRC